VQHPLVNPSLTPYGFVFPKYKERLDFSPDNNPQYINRERLIAKQWAKRNRYDATQPLPAHTIIHQILPSIATVNHITNGDFSFNEKPYLSRDLAILSTVLQWLATNVGNEFLTRDISEYSGYHTEREFVLKFEHKPNRDQRLALWLHECSPLCSKFTSECVLDVNQVTTRDRTVIDGLFRWLGKSDGRQFIANYQQYFRLQCKDAQRKNVSSVAA